MLLGQVQVHILALSIVLKDNQHAVIQEILRIFEK